MQGAHPELDVYEKLLGAGVNNIATPLGGGDVDPLRQKSQAQVYLSRGFDPRLHYRFAVKQVGRPLEEYDSAYEMVWAVYDALVGELVANLGYPSLDNST